MIATRAPARLDFGGGWTDVPPFPQEEGGFVCNVAISRYSTVTLDLARIGPEIVVDRAGDRDLAAAAMSRFGLHDLRLTLKNDFPIGSGLGGSSAAGVAAVAALALMREQELGRSEIAEVSRAIEISELGIPGGRQDHYAAAYGGALALRFGNDVEVSPIELRKGVADSIARRCLVVYTGQSRISGVTITAVMDAYRNRDTAVTSALRRMRELAEMMPAPLGEGDLDELGALVDEQWAHQRTLDPAIPTPRIDEIIARARAAGARGAKALGASGGGCVLVITGPDADSRERVESSIAGLGDVIEFAVDTSGVTRCA
jgi:D-glycero-alpha-D-manno-heptose-7-phosphate kinase